MEDHFIFSRPVVVTEEKLKGALAKQANQRALKAALDQQVMEAERLKAEAHRAKGRKKSKSANRGIAPSAPPQTLEGKTVGGAGPSSGISPAGPVPAPPPSSSSGTHAGSSSSIEPTRYTFSFKEGQATFDVADNSARLLQETLQPSSSAEGVTRARSEDGGRSSIPSSRTTRQPNVPALPPRTPSSRDSGRYTGGGSSSSSRAPRRGSLGTVGGEYQTNSLPVNFRAGKDAASGGGGNAGGRQSREASRERGGAHGAGHGGEGSYDTQSLPVELIYKLSQGAALPGAAAAAGGAPGVGAGVNVRSSPLRLKPPHLSLVTSPNRSPSSSRVSDSMGLRSPVGARPALPGSPGGVVSPRGGKPGRMNTPRDGAAGVRTSARPAGGILPPLNGHRDSDVIEMSAIIDARTPLRDSGGAGAGAARRRRTSETPKDRSFYPPGASPLSDVPTTEQACKEAERERGWAQQVKKLKDELRKARQEAAGRKGNDKANPVLSKAPRRAETAPDPPAHPPGKALRGIGGVRQRRTEGVGNDCENAGVARPTRLEKVDFSTAHIFSRDTFRPITAPEDTTSYFGDLFRSAPKRTPLPLPLVPPRAVPVPASSAAALPLEREAASKRADTPPAETDFQPQNTSSHNFGLTTNSRDDSLKLASLTTRQITLGLPDYGDGEPVPIQFLHLHQFVEAQIITADQAERLWDFFSLSAPAEFGGSHGGVGSSPTPEDGDCQKRSSVGADSYDGPGEEDTEPENELPSHAVEVEEIFFGRAVCAPPHRAEVGGGDCATVRQATEEVAVADRDGVDVDGKDDFFTPRPLSHAPANAVLAPALRRKISQLHSEEAALLLQRQLQRRNGRPRPGVASDSNPKNTRGERDAAKEDRAQMSPQRGSSPLKPLPPQLRDTQSSEPEGTFDTYSELKLSRNVLPGVGGEEEEF